MSAQGSADLMRVTGNDNGGRGTEMPSGDRWRARGGFVAIGFLLVAAFLLFWEHRVHVLGYLPFLLLLACPLMHLFMHHGHGHHGGHGGSSTDTEANSSSPTRERRHA